MNIAVNPYDEALDRIASMLRLLGQRLTEIVDATRLQNASEAGRKGAEGISGLASDLERTALSDPAARCEVIRMTADLRRMEGLVDSLAERIDVVRAVQQAGDAGDRLKQMFDLTLALIGETQDAVSRRDPERARAAAEVEEDLDEWYDLLLAEMFEDIAEGSATPSAVHEVAMTAKLLERVGGRAIEVAENVARILATRGEA